MRKFVVFPFLRKAKITRFRRTRTLVLLASVLVGLQELAVILVALSASTGFSGLSGIAIYIPFVLLIGSATFQSRGTNLREKTPSPHLAWLYLHTLYWLPSILNGAILYAAVLYIILGKPFLPAWPSLLFFMIIITWFSDYFLLEAMGQDYRKMSGVSWAGAAGFARLARGMFLKRKKAGLSVLLKSLGMAESLFTERLYSPEDFDSVYSTLVSLSETPTLNFDALVELSAHLEVLPMLDGIPGAFDAFLREMGWPGGFKRIERPEAPAYQRWVVFLAGLTALSTLLTALPEAGKLSFFTLASSFVVSNLAWFLALAGFLMAIAAIIYTLFYWVPIGYLRKFWPPDLLELQSTGRSSVQLLFPFENENRFKGRETYLARRTAIAKSRMIPSVTSIGDLQQLVDEGEDTRVEFKVEVSEEVLRDLPTRLASMANSEGGMIIFGVSDNREPVGLNLKGDERDRISQCASKCIPAVSLEFDDVKFGKQTFLVVKIPKSKVIHCDPQWRYPVRTGNITGFLETFGLTAVLRERNVIRSEGLPEQPLFSAPRKRDPIDQGATNMIVKALGSENPRVRLEGLRDLLLVQYNAVTLENQSIADSVERILSSGNTDEIKFVLDFLRTVTIWGTVEEKKVAGRWMNTVLKIGLQTTSAESARSAFNVLLYAGDPGGIRLFQHWITDSDDATWNTLQPPNMLRDIGRLKTRAREEMYSMLETDKDERTQKRLSLVLDGLRQTYP